MEIRTLNEAEVFGQIVSDEELANVSGGKHDMAKDEPSLYRPCKQGDSIIFLAADRI